MEILIQINEVLYDDPVNMPSSNFLPFLDFHNSFDFISGLFRHLDLDSYWKSMAWNWS